MKKDYDIDRLRELIAKCNWVWASTMPDIPHEYICKGKCALTIPEFYEFVDAQRNFGTHERWGNYNHQYLYIDGWKYWTMGNSYEVTKIMNRARIFDCFDTLGWPIPKIYDRTEAEIMVATIEYAFQGLPVFECGFGRGDFVKISGIKPANYYGIDPSKNAVLAFRNEFKGFYKRCAQMSFEEANKKWQGMECVVVALFGMASYFMWEYLKLLADSGRDYCLMFYKEGYVPEEFKEMYPFQYTYNRLGEIFPRAYVYNHQKYMTYSSRKLVWRQPKNERNLFPEFDE